MRNFRCYIVDTLPYNTLIFKPQNIFKINYQRLNIIHVKKRNIWKWIGGLGPWLSLDSDCLASMRTWALCFPGENKARLHGAPWEFQLWGERVRKTPGAWLTSQSSLCSELQVNSRFSINKAKENKEGGQHLSVYALTYTHIHLHTHAQARNTVWFISENYFIFYLKSIIVVT